MEDASVPPKTPSKSRGISEKLKCQVHKREKIQFLCETDNEKICASCVPLHSSHSMIPLKEKCSEHVTIWKKLKIEAINWKKKLETLGDKLPSEKLENFNKR